MNDDLVFERKPATTLSLPVQAADNNPRLEFRDGQFLFAMTNQGGGIVERFVSAAAVREAFSQIPIDSGWLPPEIVRWGNGRNGEWAVAYFPPTVRALEISNESQENAGVDRLDVPLPGMFFFGMGTNYFVWASKESTCRPHHELYRCPLPNVYQDGAVCWGVVKPQRASGKTLLDAWKLFIESTFNNHLAAGKSKKYREDVRLMLREVAADWRWGLSRTPTILYPVSDLVRQVETGVSLDTALRQYLETGEMPQ